MEPRPSPPQVDPLAFLLSLGRERATAFPSPLHGRTVAPRGPSPRPEATPSRTAVQEIRPPRPAPPKAVPAALKEVPQKLTEYVSPLVNASRLAYMAAPPHVRTALDQLLAVPDFWRMDRNPWAGDVGAWTRTGSRSAQGEAVLKRFPLLRQWVLDLRAKCWQPWEIGRQFFTPEDLAALRVAVPDEIEGLPEVLRRRRR